MEKSNVQSPLFTKYNGEGGGFGLTGLENQTLLANLTLSHNMANQMSDESAGVSDPCPPNSYSENRFIYSDWQGLNRITDP